MKRNLLSAAGGSFVASSNILERRGIRNSTPKSSSFARRRAAFAAAVLGALGSAGSAFAGNVYWDTNGATLGAGAGITAGGTWDGTNAFWNSDPLGGAGTFTTDVGAGNIGIFAAGGSATGSYTVTSTGTRQVGGITVEEG